MPSLTTEVWVADIAKNLFPDNSLIARSMNWDKYVEDGKVVNVPQAGAAPGTQINRTVLPAPVLQRTDSNAFYNLPEFTSDPSLVRDIEEAEVAYDKRADVLRDHVETLNTFLTDYLLTQWFPLTGPRIIKHTGDARDAGALGATGTRRRLTLADVKLAKRRLDLDRVPSTGRFIALDAYQLDDLLEDPKLTSRDYVEQYNLENGTIGKLLGLGVYVRDYVTRTNNVHAGAKAVNAASAATDNAAGFVWHEKFVTRALGSIKPYANIDDATLYGSVFSAAVRGGGLYYYATQRGVVGLAEQVPA